MSTYLAMIFNVLDTYCNDLTKTEARDAHTTDRSGVADAFIVAAAFVVVPHHHFLVGTARNEETAVRLSAMAEGRPRVAQLLRAVVAAVHGLLHFRASKASASITATAGAA